LPQQGVFLVSFLIVTPLADPLAEFSQPQGFLSHSSTLSWRHVQYNSSNSLWYATSAAPPIAVAFRMAFPKASGAGSVVMALKSFTPSVPRRWYASSSGVTTDRGSCKQACCFPSSSVQSKTIWLFMFSSDSPMMGNPAKTSLNPTSLGPVPIPRQKSHQDQEAAWVQ